MNRRGSVLALLGLGVAAAPLVAKAQHAGRVYQIGFVSPTSPGSRNVAFVQGLRELGYVQGRNGNIAMRFAEGEPERLPGLVEEVIRLKVDVLVVGSTVGASPAKRATSTIPIVFAGSSDPVAGGIVANLSRPGGQHHWVLLGVRRSLRREVVGAAQGSHLQPLARCGAVELQ